MTRTVVVGSTCPLGYLDFLLALYFGMGEVTFNASWNGAKEVLLWVQDEAGVVSFVCTKCYSIIPLA
jgi:hypothetical protein